MRIALVNGWHDDNKGDSGIVEATIGLLLARDPDCSISLVSTLTVEQAFFPTAHRHLLLKYPKLQVFPSPFPDHSWTRDKKSIWRILIWSMHMAKALLALCLGIRRPAGVKAIADAELVISKGGHIFYAKKDSFHEWAQLLKMLYPLIVALRFRRPFLILGQSLGPFQGRIARRIASYYFGKARGIMVREGLSLETARELGLDMSKVSLVPDLAFFLRPESTPRLKSLLARTGLEAQDFLAVTVRQWPPSFNGKEPGQISAFILEMAKLIEQLVSAGRFSKIAIVAHAMGPLVIEDDRWPSRQLFGLLERLGDRIVLVEDDLSPGELAALYGAAKVLVGTRFHSVIFALAAGTPAYAISYFGPKAPGIMSMVGMEALCVDIEEFSAEAAMSAISGLDAGISMEIRHKIDDFRLRFFETIDVLAQ